MFVDILLLGIVYSLVDWLVKGTHKMWFSKILLVFISARNVSRPYENIVLAALRYKCFYLHKVLDPQFAWPKSGLSGISMSR